MIFCQVFHMFDNMWNNIIIYSGPDKKLFTPFFYDLDMSLREARNNNSADVFSVEEDTYFNYETYKGIWLKMKDLWWENIVERYKFLRHEILSVEQITKTAYEIKKGIFPDDFDNEILKWQNANDSSLNDLLNLIEKRLFFCDNYFNVDISGEITKTGVLRQDINNKNKFFNFNGQRVTNPYKGIYIVNGHKVVFP